MLMRKNVNNDVSKDSLIHTNILSSLTFRIIASSSTPAGLMLVHLTRPIFTYLFILVYSI